MIFEKQKRFHLFLMMRSRIQRMSRDSLLRNSFYIMSTTAATGAIGYAYWVVATHLYSVHNVGLASALLSVMALAATLANLGVGSTLVQMLPQCKTNYAWSLTLNAGLATGGLASLLVGGIAVVALPLFSQQFSLLWRSPAYISVFMAGVFLSTSVILLDQAFIAERAASNMLTRNITFALLKLLLLALFALLGTLGIFSSWVVALAGSLLVASLLLVLRVRRGYCLAVRGMGRQIRSMLSSLAGHHLINIGGQTPNYVLPVLVTGLLSATDNAYFATAWMLAGLFSMISPSVATSLFAEGSHTPDEMMRKARTSAILIGLLLAPVILVVLFGGHYILLMFGPRYAEHGALLLIILTLEVIPDAITNIYVSVLRVQRRLRHAALLNLSMATLTLILAWILLPKIGIAGGGLAFLISETVGSLVAGIDLLFFRHHHQRRIAAIATWNNPELVEARES